MSEKRFKKVGDQSLINEEEEEYENDAGSPSSQEKESKNENGDSCVGKLMFSLEHDMHRESLTVVVMKISDLRLPASDANQQPQQQQLQQLFDPYVRVVLLPEGKQKAKTRVVRRTKNPIFEETFTFYGISSQKLQQMIIKFTVMTHDRFSKDTCMGHVILAMTPKLVKRDRQAVTICKTIRSGSEPAQKQGELFISLNFDSSTDKLTVIVLKGKNFPRMDIAGLADPYVKIYLMCDGQRIDKKKTQVKKRTLNPVFNETFHFNLPSHHLRQQQQKDRDTKIMLKFIVLDWDRVSKNEVIGVVQIGPDVVSDVAVKHWNDVMECPRKQLAVWHKLL
ncbi:synaptotagmin 4 [Helobdella robusta]|uniref:Synaptotagmin 4 n=1 Tax=Helobdella robusta TaxID=6412 RepID=T1FXJ4_HELRO|nr:synaptotagmin 4 [Helobdella robusta]ESO12768.1 synaptotagmin 4 [Helobdella robusta]